MRGAEPGSGEMTNQFEGKVALVTGAASGIGRASGLAFAREGAVWLCMKYEIPQMLKHGGGAIVNTASTAGLVGLEGAPAYCASKAGVVQLTRAAALDYAKAWIRINAVCPGVIRTPMVEPLIGTEAEAGLIAMEPIGRMGKPEEVAEAVVWLCSNAAAFVTGIAMPLDGGLVAK